MAISKEEIAIIKGMLAYRSAENKSFLQQDICAHFKINSARVTEIRYEDKGIGVGIEPAPKDKFPEECWKWSLIKPRKDMREANIKKRRKLARNGGIPPSEITDRIKPIAKAILDESTKRVIMSASAVALQAGLLIKCLDEWNKLVSKTSKGAKK